MDTNGSLIIDLEGHILTTEEKELLTHPLVGGVILFTRNYTSNEELCALTASIRAISPDLLIMADQEGGRVQRFIAEFTRLPAMGLFGHLYDESPKSALQLANDCGWLMATEILASGLDLSLAPVLDLKKNLNKAIGDRAFHVDPKTVTLLAKAFIQGMNEAGMVATGKHFPGHGSVDVDSHISLPKDERSLEEIIKSDIYPFAQLVKNDLACVMAAHIVFPAVDNLPVGYSNIWLQKILREQLSFTGVILSDDLNMEGANISANYTDRFISAKDVGCDFVLLCNNRKGVEQVLDNLAYEPYLVPEHLTWILKGQVKTKKPLKDNGKWCKIQQNLLGLAKRVSEPTF